jgi:uncharacterized membrane protein (UPF0127 family)
MPVLPVRPLVIVTLLLAQAACSGTGGGLTEPVVLSPPALVADIVFPSTPSPHRIAAVVRATDAETEVGLMYRKERLSDDEGMLFAFGDDRDHSFWMKNTFISLDLIYLDARGEIVGIIADVPPLSLESRSVGRPSRYVLEVQAGFASRHGLALGQTLDITMREAGST